MLSILNILITFCNIVIMICAIVGVYNYFVIEKRKKIEVAISLAKYYKDNVLDNISIICALYKKLEIDKIVDSLDSKKMINFDSEEQSELLKNDIDSFKNMHERKDYIPSVLSVSDIYNLNLYGVEFKEEKKKNSAEQDKNIRIAKVEPQVLKSSIARIRSNVLNSLEYFAMNFISGVADERNVYQSLSQTYIEVVKYLYYNISNLNHRANPKKYYTNVIELFKIWSNRLNNSIESSKNINLKIKTNKL